MTKLLIGTCMAAMLPLYFASTASAGLGPNLNPAGADGDSVHLYNPTPMPAPTKYTTIIQYRRGHHRAR